MKYNLETLLYFTANNNIILLSEETKEPISRKKDILNRMEKW